MNKIKHCRKCGELRDNSALNKNQICHECRVLEEEM
mgnify:CR=1 FL=1